MHACQNYYQSLVRLSYFLLYPANIILRFQIICNKPMFSLQGIGVMLDGLFGTGTGSTVSV